MSASGNEQRRLSPGGTVSARGCAAGASANAFLLNCSWNPSSGAAVRFVNVSSYAGAPCAPGTTTPEISSPWPFSAARRTGGGGAEDAAAGGSNGSVALALAAGAGATAVAPMRSASRSTPVGAGAGAGGCACSSTSSGVELCASAAGLSSSRASATRARASGTNADGSLWYTELSVETWRSNSSSRPGSSALRSSRIVGLVASTTSLAASGSEDSRRQ